MTPSQHLFAASRTSITHCTPGQDIFSCVYDDDDYYNDEDGDNDDDIDDDDDADLGKTRLAPPLVTEATWCCLTNHPSFERRILDFDLGNKNYTFSFIMMV